MRAVSLVGHGPRAHAGSPSQKHSLPPIKHTILNRIRVTDVAQMPKLSGTGGIATDTTAPRWGGNQSHLRLTGHGTTGAVFGLTLATPWNFTTTDSYLRFAVRCSNYTYGKNFIVNIATTKADYQAGNYHKYNGKPAPGAGAVANWYPPGNWSYDGIHPGNMSVIGNGANLASIGYICISALDTNTSNATVWDVAEFQMVKAVGTKAKCVIWHDDSVPDGAEAIYNKLQAYGFVGCEATEWESIPNLTGINGAFQLQKYRDAGWTAGTHAISPGEHTDVSAESVANQAFRAKIQNRRWRAKGESADFTYWGGLRSTIAYDPIRMFYRSGRWNTSGLTMPELQPPADPTMMKALLAATGETFATNWQPLLTNAIAVKGIAQYVFHQDVSSNSTFAAEFDKLLAWLDQNRASIDVVTLPTALAASVA